MMKPTATVRELAEKLSQQLNGRDQGPCQITSSTSKIFTFLYREVSFTLTKRHRILKLTFIGEHKHIEVVNEVVVQVRSLALDFDFGLRLYGLNQAEIDHFSDRGFEAINHGEYWELHWYS